MDAKPQRPLRAIRGGGDENLAPTYVPSKTIHHRNKSSPNLSSLMHAPALKQTAKRTVFGDMSNMAPARMHKDDSALSEKMSHEKAVQIITEKAKANAALMRPAQRPANTAAAKPHSFGTTSEDNALATRMPLESLIAANARKTVAKKSTTVFKDNAPVATTNAVVPVSKPAVSHDQNSAEYLASVQERLRLAAETNFPYNASHTAGRSNNALKSNLIRAPATLVPSNAESFNPYADLYRPYNPATGNPIVMQGPSSKDAPAPRARVVREESRAGGLPRATVNPLQIAAAPETKLPTAQVKVETDAQKENAIVPYAANHNLTEPEEYWPEEEDNYEDDGYVTARSCYSRGDNTTGGVTTVIFPRVTGLVKKELAQAAIAVESVRTEEDIEDERWDTSMVAEYGEEIFSYMRELEVKMLPDPHYMDLQNEIQWSMRGLLVDWLVQVHHRFNLLPETLFLTVNYIDRFLSAKVVSLGRLQLVGATALFIAAKYEEINCPSIQEIVFMVDSGYSVDEILKAERFMLSMLGFQLGWPGPMSFLRRISKADDYDLETRTLAKYFLEITIVDERFVASPPSFTAAGAHCLARLMLRKGDWSLAHVYYSGYTWSQLRSLVSLMLECCESPLEHHSAVYDKYRDKRFKRASLFVESEMRKGFNIEMVLADYEVESKAALETKAALAIADK